MLLVLYLQDGSVVEAATKRNCVTDVIALHFVTSCEQNHVIFYLRSIQHRSQ
jgi:hypothetical protein